MLPSEIYLAKFPFGDVPGMKLRPVLLLSVPVGPVPEVLVAYISSVVPARLMASDLVLNPAAPENRSTNLKTISTLRLHKLATIHCSSLERYLGVLNSAAYAAAASKLKQFLQL